MRERVGRRTKRGASKTRETEPKAVDRNSSDSTKAARESWRLRSTTFGKVALLLTRRPPHGASKVVPRVPQCVLSWQRHGWTICTHAAPTKRRFLFLPFWPRDATNQRGDQGKTADSLSPRGDRSENVDDAEKRARAKPAHTTAQQGILGTAQLSSAKSQRLTRQQDKPKHPVST